MWVDLNLKVPAIAIDQLNTDYIREASYKYSELIHFVKQNIYRSPSQEQRQVFEHVFANANSPTNQKLCFLDAPGGTGKLTS